MSKPSFDTYLGQLAAVSAHPIAAEPAALELCAQVTAALELMDPLDRGSLTALVSSNPDVVPVLAAVAGLSQERLRTWLTRAFQTAGWVRLARTRPADLVTALDTDFDLVALLTAQRARSWTWADVLARVMSPRQTAGGSVQQGRNLEDAVEARVRKVGLPFAARTRFSGQNGLTAPADFAIPSGPEALIVVAVKGFDSTGSKLSDAAREIEEMVKIKTSRQFVFAIVDGQGWLRRQGDLRRIHTLWVNDVIDGVYGQKNLDGFELALRDAARRLSMLD